MKDKWTIVKETAVLDGGVREIGYTVLPWIPIYDTLETAMDACSVLHEEGFPIGWVVIQMGQLFEQLREEP